MPHPRRYDSPSGDPNIGEESARDLEAIDTHIEESWGGPSEVFHEIVSEYVHIDLHVVPPSEHRPYHVIITSGMSDRPMNAPEGREDCRYCELLVALPPEWPMQKPALSAEEAWWPFRRLKAAARFPHEYETWLWYGHTISEEDPPEPYAKDVGFCAGVLSVPVLCPEQARSLKICHEKEIHFFAFIPIYAAELEFARESSSDALFERLDGQGVTELVEKTRGSVC